MAKKKRKKKRSRRGQLVCQHLENVSREALEKYMPIIRGYVRGKQGVYALYRRNRLYYVGLTTNLVGRLRRHLKDKHAATWNRFSVYLTKGDRHLKELETLAIRIADPKGNKTQGGFANSENMRRQFRRDMRRRMDAKIDEIIPSRRKSKSIKRPQKTKMKVRTRARQKGSWPVLRDYVKKSFRIRLDYKGERHVATVRKNGLIVCDKGEFKSPSGAARAVLGVRSANGWYCWKYRRKQGEWVRLRELRKK